MGTSTTSLLEPGSSNDGTQIQRQPCSERTGAFAKTKSTGWRRLQGWRVGVASSALMAAVVFLLNLAFTITAALKWQNKAGVGTMYEGSCTLVNNWSTGLHLLINVLSSILLAGSNYTMQCLAAPTRGEVARAHKAGDWMDIGVPSFRNVFGRIAMRRVALWYLLALSSVPLHLVYNSTIFKTTNSTRYGK